MAATQEYVQSRILPVEQAVQKLTEKIDEMSTKLLSRDADVESAEKRFEEISQTVQRVKQELKELAEGVPERSGAGGGSRPDELMKSPALRTVSPYGGDHRLYNKWRSKIRGVLFTHSEHYRGLLKMMESLSQPELPARSEGAAEYESTIEKIAAEIGAETQVVTKLSLQLHGLLTAHCEDTALAMVDALDDHGPLGGLEAWRRIFAEQRGTMAQRIDNLRDKVIYPERISQITDVMSAITSWEKSYSELVEMSAGNFKLDEKGRIGALKRLLPQEIVSSMILVSTSLRTYREARSFAP